MCIVANRRRRLLFLLLLLLRTLNYNRKGDPHHHHHHQWIVVIIWNDGQNVHTKYTGLCRPLSSSSLLLLLLLLFGYNVRTIHNSNIFTFFSGFFVIGSNTYHSLYSSNLPYTTHTHSNTLDLIFWFNFVSRSRSWLVCVCARM